jgi:hypothetical protein
MVQENSRERQKRLWNELHDLSRDSKATARSPTSGSGQDVWKNVYGFITSPSTAKTLERMTRQSDDLTNG